MENGLRKEDGRARRIVVRTALIAALSVAFALLFELGTLVGAPISSPYNAADWNAARIGIYFLLALPLSSFLLLNDWRKTGERFLAFLEAEDGARMTRWARRVLIGSVVLVLVTLLVGVMCLAVGNTQPGPYQLFAVCVAVVAMAFYAARRKVAQRVERVVLVALLATGFLFATMVPLYTHVSWDDHIHYDRTVAASYLINPEYTAADQMYVNHDYNDTANYSRYPYKENYQDPYDLQNQQEIYAQLNAAGEDDAGAVRMEGPTTLRGVSIVQYYLVAYIPGAIVLWLARLLSIPAVAAFMLGRLANLACYAFVVYFAIRRLRSGKLILAICALIPEAVFLASGYSYDFWVTSFTMLGFAYFLGELQRPDEPLTWRNLAIMVGAFLLGLGPKAIYVPMCAMLLFMPRAKFAKAEKGAGKRQLTHAKYVAIMLASAAFVVATIVLPMVIGGPGDGDARGGNVNPSYQIAFILSQPAAFYDIFMDFFEWYMAPDEAHHVLTDFCCVETAFLDAILVVLLPAVALLDRTRCDIAYATHPKRICMWALAFFTILLMAIALFISFTPVDAGRVNGMQGRYMIPLLFPFLALGFNLKTAGKLGTRVFGEPKAKGKLGEEAESNTALACEASSDSAELSVRSSRAESASLASLAKHWLSVPQNRYAVFCYAVLAVSCFALFLGIYDAFIEQYGRVSGMPMLDLPDWLSPDTWSWVSDDRWL